MSVETELKELIISRYKSIRQFANEIGIPGTTIQSMLNSGIENAGVKKVMKICNVLGIDTNALADGYIVEKTITPTDITVNEFEYIKKYRTLDEYGKKAVDNTLNNEYERCSAVKEGLRFTNYDEAMEYVSKQPIYAMGGFGFDKMEEEELIDKANQLYALIEDSKKYIDLD